MFTLRDSILIHAPIKRLFALSTSIEIVERELGMHPVAHQPSGQGTLAASLDGEPTSPLVSAGDTIHWKGMQFGFPNYHVSLIVPETWAPPHFFQDRMIAGRFKSFEHGHHLTETAEGTRLDDEVRFSMKLRWGGALTGGLIVAPHIRGLLRRRFDLLKALAESDGWRQYIAG